MLRSVRYAQKLSLAAFATVVLVNCNGTTSSPLSPSRVGPSGGSPAGPTFGATVFGRIDTGGRSGARLLAPMAEVSGEADPGLTVEVVGTGLSAEVDENGEFMITGLSALADVVLRVSGPTVVGGSQDVSLGTSLGEDDTVEVELSVDNTGTVAVNSVEIETESPEDDPVNDDDESDDDDPVNDDDESDDDESEDDDSGDDPSDDESDDDESDDDAEDDDSEDDDDESDDESDDDESDSEDDDSEDDGSDHDDHVHDDDD